MAAITTLEYVTTTTITTVVVVTKNTKDFSLSKRRISYESLWM